MAVIRMKDIAEDLNVSVVTVSKVLRNQGDISDATRKRVLKRAKELNYQPNWVARSLVTRRTYIIGLVAPDLMYSFFAEIAKGVSRKLRLSGYNTLISISEEDPELEAQEVELLLARQVDGLLIASTQRPDHIGLYQRLEERKIPYVLVDRQVPGVRANFVGVDDREIARVAVEHLISRGCRRIAHIPGAATDSALARIQSFQQTLARHGLDAPDSCIAPAAPDSSSAYMAMRKLLTSDPRPDGVFCYNDALAAAALNAALEAGLSVPGDVAIMGAGNVHYSDLLTVPLTTVDQSSVSIGEQAAEMLLELIEAKKPKAPRTILLAPQLVERQSTKR